MKSHPITFVAQCVPGVLDGSKTQTRRVVTCQNAAVFPSPRNGHVSPKWWREHLDWSRSIASDYVGQILVPDKDGTCSYAVGCRMFVGGRLWMQEAYQIVRFDRRDPEHRAWGKYLVDETGFHGVPFTDAEWEKLCARKYPFRPSPARFMYRSLSRLTRELTDVRVERVRDISEEDIRAEGVTDFAIMRLLGRVSRRFKTMPLRWIHGADEGLDYCQECAKKRIEELKREEPDEEFLLDGGWVIESDGQEFCETCGVALDNSYTTYACEEELACFEKEGFDVGSPAHCYALERILGAEGMCAGKLGGRIARLGWRVLWDSINAKRGYDFASNPWCWALTFRKAEGKP